MAARLGMRRAGNRLLALASGSRVLAYGYDPESGAVSRSMRLSNGLALTVGALLLVRIAGDLVLRGGTVALFVHVPALVAIAFALWLARAERRDASRLLVLAASAFVLAGGSHLLGRSSGSHYYAPALAVVAWLMLPRQQWPWALAVNFAAALIFANAELRLPEVGPASDPALIGYMRGVALVASFAILAGASWMSMRGLRLAQIELEHQARTDVLTGTFNRRWFVALSALELARAKRHARPLSMALIDIDHFKAVNDTYGHHAGDAVLRSVVEAIGLGLRKTDILGRVGGEELAILLPETNLAGAAVCVERVLRRIEAASTKVDGHAIRVTASAGVTCADDADTTVEDVLARADAGLYDAKAAGRDRLVTVESPESVGE